jgi:hypothetical protein
MQIESLFRSRIQIGNHSVLRSFQATCPKCSEPCNVLWPIGILWIPQYRTVSLECPYCDAPFLVIACDLVPAESAELRSSEAYIP